MNVTNNNVSFTGSLGINTYEKLIKADGIRSKRSTALLAEYINGGLPGKNTTMYEVFNAKNVNGLKKTFLSAINILTGANKSVEVNGFLSDINIKLIKKVFADESLISNLEKSIY